MDERTFLDNFGTIAEAPGGVDRLRGLVLELALSGRLVQADSSDICVDELLDRARELQTELLATGEIQPVKATRPLLGSDAPHPIPNHWRWARLGDVVAILDFRRRPVKREERLRRVRGKREDELYPYYGATQQAGLIDDYLFDEELVLLGEDGAPFLTPNKRVAYVVDGKYWVNNHAHALRGLAVTHQFLANALNRTDFRAFVSGTTRLKLTQGKMIDIPVPIAPLAEQMQVVAKVDELMQLCDGLGARQQARHQITTRLRSSSLDALTNAETDDDLHAAWSRIHTNWEALTDHPDSIDALRQTILELAVRGKLASQDPHEGSGRDLIHKTAVLRDRGETESKSEVDLAARLHLIPPSWVWVKLGAIIDGIEAGKSPTAQPRPKTGDEWGVLKVSACSWGSFRPDENKALLPGTPPHARFEVKSGDFLISRANTQELVARSVVVHDTPPRLLISDKTLRLTPSMGCDPEYLNLANLAAVARAHYERSASGTSDSMRNVSQAVIKSAPIPLPPAAEQRRVVDRYRTLMHRCDELELALERTRSTSKQLAVALTASAR